MVDGTLYTQVVVTITTKIILVFGIQQNAKSLTLIPKSCRSKVTDRTQQDVPRIMKNPIPLVRVYLWCSSPPPSWKHLAKRDLRCTRLKCDRS